MLPSYAWVSKPFNLVGVDARNRLLSEENPHGSLVDELARQDHGLILTKGKGGVGKATVAAAVAVALVNRGLPVHLTTSDPAAHLKGTLARAVEHLTIRCRTLIRPYRLLAESEDSRVATPTRQRFIELPHKTHRSGWPAHPAGSAEPGGPWQAVTDALPEPYVPVLICQAAGAVSALKAVHVAQYCLETRTFSKPLEPGTVRLYHRVTHWMPLPGLPGDGNGGPAANRGEAASSLGSSQA